MATEQNFKNHRQVVYSYYLLTGVPILILITFACIRYSQATGTTRDLWLALLLVGWILLTMLFRSRGFALIAQDRAIRAEESLRYYIITGKPLDPRLTLSQIIALRFASDAELPALAARAAEQGLSNKEIKGEIRNWKADLRRV
jgi:hypothetical protein